MCSKQAYVYVSQYTTYLLQYNRRPEESDEVVMLTVEERCVLCVVGPVMLRCAVCDISNFTSYSYRFDKRGSIAKRNGTIS